MTGRPAGPDDTLPGQFRPQALCEGVGILFTGRAGGVSAAPFGALNLSDGVGDDPSAVAANRDLVLRAIAPDARRMAWLRQVHGTTVVQVTDLPGPTQPASQGSHRRPMPSAPGCRASLSACSGPTAPRFWWRTRPRASSVPRTPAGLAWRLGSPPP